MPFVMMTCALAALGPIVAFSTSAETVTWRLPPETVTTDFCRVTANGRPLDVFALPVPPSPIEKDDAYPYYAVFFDADAVSEVAIEYGQDADLSNARILPRSAGVAADVVASGRIRFRALPPFSLVVEPSGRHKALVVVANRPDRDVPDRRDPKVKWMDPGLHRENISLSSGETLYLAPGAVVEGNLSAVGNGITVRGRGIFSGIPWKKKAGPGAYCWHLQGRDICVRDLVFASGWSWSVVVMDSEDVLLDSIRVLGGHVLEDDAVDVCRSKHIRIRNSFLRSQDDCVAAKWKVSDLLVENCTLWTDAANGVRIGWECDAKEGGFENLTFRNIDMLHLSLAKRPASALWARCAVQVQASNATPIRNVSFDTVRFDSVETGDVLLNAATGGCGNNYVGPGTIDGLHFRRVWAPKDSPKMAVRLAAADEAHPVGNVVFEDVCEFEGPELVRVPMPKIVRTAAECKGR